MATTEAKAVRVVVSVVPDTGSLEYRLRQELAYLRQLLRAAEGRLELALERPVWWRRMVREALGLLKEG